MLLSEKDLRQNIFFLFFVSFDYSKKFPIENPKKIENKVFQSEE